MKFYIEYKLYNYKYKLFIDYYQQFEKNGS